MARAQQHATYITTEGLSITEGSLTALGLTDLTNAIGIQGETLTEVFVPNYNWTDFAFVHGCYDFSIDGSPQYWDNFLPVGSTFNGYIPEGFSETEWKGDWDLLTPYVHDDIVEINKRYFRVVTDNVGYSPLELPTERTEVITLNDTSGSLTGTYFTIYSPNGTAYDVWYRIGGSPAFNPGTGIGIRVDISIGELAKNVAGFSAQAINALPEFSADASNGVLIVTSNSIGTVVDSTDVTTGFSIATIRQGLSINNLWEEAFHHSYSIAIGTPPNFFIFPYRFPIYDKREIEVYQDNILLTVDTDYHVSIPGTENIESFTTTLGTIPTDSANDTLFATGATNLQIVNSTNPLQIDFLSVSIVAGVVEIDWEPSVTNGGNGPDVGDQIQVTYLPSNSEIILFTLPDTSQYAVEIILRRHLRGSCSWWYDQLGSHDKINLVYIIPDLPETRIQEHALVDKIREITFHYSSSLFRDAFGLNPIDEHNREDYELITASHLGLAPDAGDQIQIGKSVGRIQPWIINGAPADIYQGVSQVDYHQGLQITVNTLDTSEITVPIEQPLQVCLNGFFDESFTPGVCDLYVDPITSLTDGFNNPYDIDCPESDGYLNYVCPIYSSVFVAPGLTQTILNDSFGLPTNFNWSGQWDASINYPISVVVQFNNILYTSLLANISSQPDLNPLDWLLTDFLWDSIIDYNKQAIVKFESPLWDSGSSYVIGDYVIRSSIKYIALINNSNSDPTPPQEWNNMGAYIIGDFVVQNQAIFPNTKIKYTALTVNSGSNPETNPLDWQAIPFDWSEPDWDIADSYAIGDFVKRFNNIYVATINNIGVDPSLTGSTWKKHEHNLYYEAIKGQPLEPNIANYPFLFPDYWRPLRNILDQALYSGIATVIDQQMQPSVESWAAAQSPLPLPNNFVNSTTVGPIEPLPRNVGLEWLNMGLVETKASIVSDVISATVAGSIPPIAGAYPDAGLGSFNAPIEIVSGFATFENINPAGQVIEVIGFPDNSPSPSITGNFFVIPSVDKLTLFVQDRDVIVSEIAFNTITINY